MIIKILLYLLLSTHFIVCDFNFNYSTNKAGEFRYPSIFTDVWCTQPDELSPNFYQVSAQGYNLILTSKDGKTRKGCATKVRVKGTAGNECSHSQPAHRSKEAFTFIPELRSRNRTVCPSWDVGVEAAKGLSVKVMKKLILFSCYSILEVAWGKKAICT